MNNGQAVLGFGVWSLGADVLYHLRVPRIGLVEGETGLSCNLLLR